MEATILSANRKTQVHPLSATLDTQTIDDLLLGEPEALAGQNDLRSQKLSDLMTANQSVSADELMVAFALQDLSRNEGKAIKKLGEVLVDIGFLTAEELEVALKEQKEKGKAALGQLLIDKGSINQGELRVAQAIRLGIPLVNLRKFNIPAKTIRNVPVSIAKQLTVIPIIQIDSSLVAAVEDPLAPPPLDVIRFNTGLKIIPVMAEVNDIRAAIRKNYDLSEYSDSYSAYAGDSAQECKAHDGGELNIPFSDAPAEESLIDNLASQLATEAEELQLTDEPLVDMDTTLVKLINAMIVDAHRQGVSDIHIESNPGNKNMRIRFRKDGAMIKYLDLSSEFCSSMVSRIKIMSTLDITERRKPQDGKIDFGRFGPIPLELRVATIPTNNGLEDVVMRLLAAAQALPMEQLGLSEEVLHKLQQMMAKPHGLCLVCGPTGSGKTTTLHSLLGHINTGERKIWTAEDPVEITQEGLRQVQVNAKIGWTFASAMRTFLRADPDVIMVGEMRDAETTKVGIEASLTGHMVLSTLHTNSAAESIVRLLDLGMDPFNFADALLFILAQRLARRLCPACKKAYSATPVELEELVHDYCLETSLDPGKVLASWRQQFRDPRGSITLYKATGCNDCGHTGYQGRVGLYELLLADATVKRLIQTRGTVAEIKAAAIAAGMQTLIQNGIEKILQGVTNITQVRAICG